MTKSALIRLAESHREGAPMKKRFCALAVLSVCLSACASFSGAPDPVITVADAQSAITGNKPGEVIQRMKDMTADQRTLERNRIVASYLLAADAKYGQFRRRLSWDVKGGNVLFDVATLGLTGLASSWKSAADDLAAAATVVGGTRASLNRELYFEKTLPTLLSLMDSSRLAVRADILKGLAQPETAYTIQDAFSDLWLYEEAATIDGAIQQAAAAAARKADEVAIDYSKAVKFCTVSDAVANERLMAMTALEDLVDESKHAPAELAENRKILQQAAIAAGVSNAPLAANDADTSTQLDQISDYLLSLCNAEPVAAFKAKLTEKGVTFSG
jgi:hypothetical protein